MTNQDVAQAWVGGNFAASDHLFTDGRNLYSYGLKIGYTTSHEGGETLKIAIDHTARGGSFYSMTTSHHVALASSYADEMVNAKESE